jgi:hypothetical protein
LLRGEKVFCAYIQRKFMLTATFLWMIKKARIAAASKHLNIKKVLFDPRESEQGCQIFLATTYQNGENIPNM